MGLVVFLDLMMVTHPKVSPESYIRGHNLRGMCLGDEVRELFHSAYKMLDHGPTGLGECDG